MSGPHLLMTYLLQSKNQKSCIVIGNVFRVFFVIQKEKRQPCLFPFQITNEGASVRLEDGLRNLRREDRTIPFLASIATTPFFLFTYTIYSKKFIVNGLFAGALFHGCATNCISLFCKKAFIMTFNSDSDNSVLF